MEPGIENYDARIQEALGGPRLETVQVNGVNLTYIEKGQGDPVILVHGGPGDYPGWSSQVEIFSQKYRAIYYSRRCSCCSIDRDPVASLLGKFVS